MVRSSGMTAGHVLLALAVAVMWGLAFVATRMALDAVSPPLLTALRFLVAAAPARGLGRAHHGRALPLHGAVPPPVLWHRSRHAARPRRRRDPHPGALYHPLRHAAPGRAPIAPAMDGDGHRLCWPRGDRGHRRSRSHRDRPVPHGPGRHELRPRQRAPEAAAGHGYPWPGRLAESRAAAARARAVRRVRRPTRVDGDARRG